MVKKFDLTKKRLRLGGFQLLLLCLTLSCLLWFNLYRQQCCPCVQPLCNKYDEGVLPTGNLDSVTFRKATKPTIDLPIHFSFLAGGTQSSRQIVTLLKSLLHYINWSRICDQFLESSEANSYAVHTTPNAGAFLRLHFIVDDVAARSIPALLDSWALPGVTYNFYRFNNYQNEVSWIPTTHYSGSFGLVKTILDELLSNSVDKVIHLDTDLLINGDITHLWDHFRNFTTPQAIGLVQNQSPWYLKGTAQVVWPALGYGYNTGVMLLHLKKLRQLQWGRLWRDITKLALKNFPYAPLADQDIINAVLLHIPDILYEIPCEWNVQLNEHAIPGRCPVAWEGLNGEEISRVSSPRELSSVKIVHFNSPYKPDSMLSSWILQSRYHTSDSGLRRRFMELYRYFKEYDGLLIKNRILEFMRPESKANRRHMTEETNTSDECFEFTLQKYIQRRIHPFYLRYNFQSDVHSATTAKPEFQLGNPSKTHKVTLISQLTFDRIHRLELLSQRWAGPMSLALYLTDREADLLIDFVMGSKYLANRTDVGYHVIYKEGLFYPINQLRNLAMEYAETEYVFLVDVDFIPSGNSSESLELLVNSLPEPVPAHLSHSGATSPLAGRRCFIVPAFEIKEELEPLPNSKAELISLWNKGIVQPFRHEIWTAGHMATDYVKWREASKPYEVNWSADYEPYVLVRRNAVTFDESFVGFGWNKASFIMALDVHKYQFTVLPDLFLLHLPHPPSMEVLRYRTNILYRSCVDRMKLDYIKSLARKHGVQALKYLEFRGQLANR